jgi:imidazolonepropionase-like amidohydrolase
MKSLQSATIIAAQVLGLDQDLGSISRGKIADLIAVPGNPLEDISLLSHVTFVMKDGKVYKNDSSER